MKICIDAGHGIGKDCGSVGDTGLRECDVVLDVATKLNNKLNKHNINTIMTRTNNNGLSLNDRCNLANKEKCDYFISIHNNSFNKVSNGIETLVYDENSKDAIALARNVQNALIYDTGLTDRGIKYRKDLCVLRETLMNSILIELPFISNPIEEKLLASDEFRTKCAISIARGILSHLNIEYKEEKQEKENYWRVVVASNKDIEESRKLVQKLQSEGYTNAFIVKYEKE